MALRRVIMDPEPAGNVRFSTGNASRKFRDYGMKDAKTGSPNRNSRGRKRRRR